MCVCVCVYARAGHCAHSGIYANVQRVPVAYTGVSCSTVLASAATSSVCGALAGATPIAIVMLAMGGLHGMRGMRGRPSGADDSESGGSSGSSSDSSDSSSSSSDSSDSSSSGGGSSGGSDSDSDSNSGRGAVHAALDAHNPGANTSTAIDSVTLNLMRGRALLPLCPLPSDLAPPAIPLDSVALFPRLHALRVRYKSCACAQELPRIAESLRLLCVRWRVQRALCAQLDEIAEHARTLGRIGATHIHAAACAIHDAFMSSFSGYAVPVAEAAGARHACKRPRLARAAPAETLSAVGTYWHSCDVVRIARAFDMTASAALVATFPSHDPLVKFHAEAQSLSGLLEKHKSCCLCRPHGRREMALLYGAIVDCDRRAAVDLFFGTHLACHTFDSRVVLVRGSVVPETYEWGRRCRVLPIYALVRYLNTHCMQAMMESPARRVCAVPDGPPGRQEGAPVDAVVPSDVAASDAAARAKAAFLRELRDLGEAASYTCPVCLEGGPERTLVATQCGHVLCAACAERMNAHAARGGDRARCPMCRAYIGPVRPAREVMGAIKSVHALMCRCQEYVASV